MSSGLLRSGVEYQTRMALARRQAHAIADVEHHINHTAYEHGERSKHDPEVVKRVVVFHGDSANSPSLLSVAMRQRVHGAIRVVTYPLASLDTVVTGKGDLVIVELPKPTRTAIADTQRILSRRHGDAEYRGMLGPEQVKPQEVARPFSRQEVKGHREKVVELAPATAQPSSPAARQAASAAAILASRAAMGRPAPTRSRNG